MMPQPQIGHLQIQKAFQAENYTLAAKLVKEMMQNAPNDPFVWTAQARMQLLKKQFVAAKQSVARALQINNSFAWGHCMYGQIEAKQGNHKEAIEAFEFALSLEPENMDVLFDYATYLVDTRSDLTKAERWARRRLILDPDDANSHELMGRVLVASNELQDAEQSFKQAIKLDPLIEKAYIGLAKIELFHRKNAFSAVDWIRPALMLNPDSMQLRLYFNKAMNDKNSLYGFLWNSGLLYGANVKWNILLLISLLIMIPLYMFMKDSSPQFTSLLNIIFFTYFIYCIYAWSSRFFMRLLLEKRWLN
jgi:tetratricopeptide (TPR) repeat protein